MCIYFVYIYIYRFVYIYIPLRDWMCQYRQYVKPCRDFKDHPTLHFVRAMRHRPLDPRCIGLGSGCGIQGLVIRDSHYPLLN